MALATGVTADQAAVVPADGALPHVNLQFRGLDR
jgi:hypothetical protein